MNYKSTHYQQGNIAALAIFIAMGLAILILTFASSLQNRARQSTYYQSQKKAHTLAEDGINETLGKLVYANASEVIYSSGTGTDGHGFYECFAQQVVQPVTGYYILATATVSFSGHEYVSRMHSYANVVNLGEYFAAVDGLLTVSTGVQAQNGKIYALDLRFGVDPGNPTIVKNAEYVNSVFPQVARGASYDSPEDDYWGDPNTGVADLVTPTGVFVNPTLGINDGMAPFDCPRRLDAALTFPRILPEDLASWAATPDTVIQCNFSGHLSEPENRVFYCASTMTLTDVTVESQIHFVSGKSILIQGNLMKLDPSTSTHQAVLIANGDVVIATVATPQPLQVIQAMIMAPNGSLIPMAYENPAIHATLSLEFKGTMILNRIASFPNNFPNIYRVSRTYEYDPAYKAKPPRYLPAMTRIYYMFEEPPSGGGLY